MSILKGVLIIGIGLPVGIFLTLLAVVFLGATNPSPTVPAGTANASSSPRQSRDVATAEAIAADTEALKITSHTSRYVGTTLYVEGEVHNTSTRPLRYAKVAATFYGYDGEFIGAESGYVSSSGNVLQAGQTGTFRITKRNPDNTLSTYRVRPEL